MELRLLGLLLMTLRKKNWLIDDWRISSNIPGVYPCDKPMTCALHMTCKFYLHRSAIIEGSVFCLVTNSTLRDFSYHFILCYLCHFSCTFLVVFEMITKTLQFFKKDLLWLFKILFPSLNSSPMAHVNMYLHVMHQT